jgi:uncharacterized protein YjhX (UPF0386 family)
MCCENGINEKLTERLLKLMDEKDNLKNDLDTWTDDLEELAEIKDAFKTNGKFDMCEKTILDVGTDAVKPLYIALKFKPKKIVGISEWFRPFVSDIELKSKILKPTKIRFYTCSLFNKVTLDIIRDKEGVKAFNFVLVSKTLHHLRTGECIAKERDQNHKCSPDEESCIYKFEEQKIFDMLLQLGKRVIVYEGFDASEEDDDKVRGRGGYFTTEEWRQIFRYLSENSRVEFIEPLKYRLTKSKLKEIESELRQVDFICFYVEAK